LQVGEWPKRLGAGYRELDVRKSSTLDDLSGDTEPGVGEPVASLPGELECYPARAPGAGAVEQ
jgi:hypothetical protein